MSQSIKTTLEPYFSSVKINDDLLKRVERFVNTYIHRNSEHVSFFGGNLTGVESVKFTTPDRNEFLYDVISEDLDDAGMRNDVKRLPTVGENWVRATDPLNLTCLYMTHLISISSLPEKKKTQGMINILMVMHIKLITSLISYYFPHNIKRELALAAYDKLSGKYAIRKNQTWRALLEDRCQDIINNSSVHYKTVKSFEPDKAVLYWITDTQGRLRSIIKNIAEVTYALHADGSKIMSNSGLIELDGEVTMMDVKRHYEPYKRYIKEVVLERDRFIKKDCIQIVNASIVTISDIQLLEVLEYFNKCAVRKDPLVTEIIAELLEHLFNFLEHDKHSRSAVKDISYLMEKLKAIYSSSRTSDPSILQLRELTGKLIKRGTKHRNEATISSLKLALMLYIVLRTVTMHYYN